MAQVIKGSVEWVGKTDWPREYFHGREMTIRYGTAYNAYLIRGAKNILIDTVWKPYAQEFLQDLFNIIDPGKIDIVISCHGEPDHSGSLPALLARLPAGVPVYCSRNAMDSLQGQYHSKWNLMPVKTGDSIKIDDNREISFVEMPMLHWPDSMACFLTGENILFSSDAFGQHYATQGLMNDLADPCTLYYEALKYYANILQPMSGILRAKLAEIAAMNLPVQMIAPAHGVIWRKNPMQIVEQYGIWANNYKENRITVLYETMYEGTRVLAERIAQGIQQQDRAVQVRVHQISTSDQSDLIAEIFRSKTIVMGCSTVNNGVLSQVAELLSRIHEMRFQNKKAAVFGCFGWSGESTSILRLELGKSGFDVMKEDLRVKWFPDEATQNAAVEYGKKTAAL